MKARLFQTRMSSWRGLRFNFHGDYKGALGAYIGWMLLAVLTLHDSLALALWKQNRYLLGNGALWHRALPLPRHQGTVLQVLSRWPGPPVRGRMRGRGPHGCAACHASRAVQSDPECTPQIEAAMATLKVVGTFYLFGGPLILLAVAWFHAG